MLTRSEKARLNFSLAAICTCGPLLAAISIASIHSGSVHAAEARAACPGAESLQMDSRTGTIFAENKNLAATGVQIARHVGGNTATNLIEYAPGTANSLVQAFSTLPVSDAKTYTVQNDPAASVNTQAVSAAFACK